MAIRFRVICIILFALGNTIFSNVLRSQEILMKADQLEFNQHDKVLTAEGHVEIWYRGRTLQAEKVIYYQKTNQVIARGQVRITEESGNYIYAEYIDVSGDLKKGVIENFLVALEDGSRIAVARGDVDLEGDSRFEGAVYSPCQSCLKNPEKPLIWQIKSVTVIRDKDNHRLILKEAWLELFDIPVFYLPYFSIPDGTLKKQSGLLGPKLFKSSNIGLTFGLPVFINIDRSRDLTLTPYISLKGTKVLALDYRQHFSNGILNVGGSIGWGDYAETIGSNTKNYQNDMRGHFYLQGSFDINRQWRWGMDITAASDKSYLSDLNFNSDDLVTSKIFAEGFISNRSYFQASGLQFLGTRDLDINKEQAFALPRLLYYYQQDHRQSTGYWDLRGEFAALHRLEGRESQKLSFVGGWNWSSIDPSGGVWTSRLSLTTDLYHVRHVDPNSDLFNPPNNRFSGWQGRVFPQAFLEWRYPLIKSISNAENFVIEPIFSVVAAPKSSTSSKIPNEDSQDIILDDTNIFLPDRLGGGDRLDRGSRINYGLKLSYHDSLNNREFSFTIGQSYQLYRGLFPDNTGLSKHMTDVVGQANVRVNDRLDLGYRFQFDPYNKKFRRQEISLNGKFDIFRLDAAYSWLGKYHIANLDPPAYQSVNGTLTTQLGDYWTLKTFTSYDIDRKKLYSYGGSIEYNDECFIFGLSIKKRDFVGATKKNDILIGITLSLTNIGGINPSVTFK